MTVLPLVSPLVQLDRYPHFKESADMFSLQDLVQVLKGKLLTDVQDIHRVFSHHIKEDCPVRKPLGNNLTCYFRH